MDIWKDEWLEKELQGKEYKLELHKGDPCKGWLLELRTRDDEKGQAIALHFRNTGMSVLRQYDCGFYLQGESTDWIMWEFWSKNQDVIFEASFALARECGLDMQLGKIYAGM